jgi:putative transposase
MGLARSSYYYRPRCQQGKAQQDQRIAERLEELAVEFPRYGYRRMTAQLRREGLVVNHKRVLRLMREQSLLVRPRRKFLATTDSRHGLQVYPNLLRGRVVTAPDQAWVADISYVRLGAGFIYLAVLLDTYSRLAVGWALSRFADAELTCAALRRGIERRRPPAGCIHHSDRGKQYAAAAYRQLLAEHGFRISNGAKGNPYDNAQAESFIKTLKAEEVYLAEYRNAEEAASRIGEFIEQVYNKRRLHSALGYVPPAEYELSLTCPSDTPLSQQPKCPA